MTEKLLIAGAGGQGVMLLGKILAESAMREDKFVTWLPAYGAEVRGGTAYCMVVISDEQIGSPYITAADTLLVMNQPSLDKFQPRLKKGGVLIVNSSMVDSAPASPRCHAAKFTDIALSLGNIKVANMVALGYYVGTNTMVQPQTIRRVIAASAPAGKPELIEINHQALARGIKEAYGPR